MTFYNIHIKIYLSKKICNYFVTIFSINSNMVKTTAGCNKINKIPKNKILVESDGPFTKIGKKTFSPELLNSAYEVISNCTSDSNFVDMVNENFRRILIQ